MNNEFDAVIGYVNAGGRGTRLNSIFNPDVRTGIAKALLEIGTPKIKLIDHHIANLRSQGIENVVIAAGDQPEVYEYIQDTYRSDALVTATRSEEQLGTGGDLVRYVEPKIISNVLIQNVDTILDIELSDFFQKYSLSRELGGLASIALSRNQGVPNESAYVVGNLNEVVYSAEFCSPHEEIVADSFEVYKASSTGAVMMSSELLKRGSWDSWKQPSIYRHILRAAWETNALYAYDNGFRFFRDIGTVATWLYSQNDSLVQSQLRYNNE